MMQKAVSCSKGIECYQCCHLGFNCHGRPPKEELLREKYRDAHGRFAALE